MNHTPRPTPEPTGRRFATSTICKPDDVVGSLDPSATLPLEQNAPVLVMFCRSTLTVALEDETIVDFAATIATSPGCAFTPHPAAGVSPQRCFRPCWAR